MGRGSLHIVLVAAALLLTAVPSAQPRQEAVHLKKFSSQREVNQSRTWSIWVNIETCGDVTVDRIDQYTLDGSPNQGIVVSGNQLKILQWTVDDVIDRELLLGDVLAEMSLRRYVFRVWIRVAGRPVVRFFYFSPFGASDEKMPPLPPEATHDHTLRFRWMSLHKWTPRSPWNPERNAFDHFFPRLLRHMNSKMDLKLRLDGPGCKRNLHVLTSNERSRNVNIRDR